MALGHEKLDYSVQEEPAGYGVDFDLDCDFDLDFDETEFPQDRAANEAPLQSLDELK